MDCRRERKRGKPYRNPEERRQEGRSNVRHGGEEEGRKRREQIFEVHPWRFLREKG